jgi:hypothetical protein
LSFRIFPDRQPSCAALCRRFVCYLTRDLGRRRISSTLSAAQNSARQTNSCLSHIGFELSVSSRRTSGKQLFEKTRLGSLSPRIDRVNQSQAQAPTAHRAATLS